MRPKLFAVLAVAVLLFAGLAPVVAAEGDLSVSANQPTAGGGATVTVTHNGTAAENATVGVDATDGNYSGEGSYTTDENGTATLPAPEENVTLEITAEWENHTASTTAELVVAAGNSTHENDSFGQQVSWYVHQLLDGWEDERGIGQAVAEFVVENNPGNAPDHAGPPDGPNSNAAGNGGNQTAVGGQSGGGPPDNPGNGKAKGHGK